jgi:dienelactone hydrolase
MRRRLAILALLALVPGAACMGPRTPSASPEELSVRLRVHDEIQRPEGQGPFPTVLLVPGCTGTQDFHRGWARFFVETGFAAVILDSFTGRGFAPGCAGERGWGRERAGEILVTLDDLRGRRFVDAERLALVGWAQGGRAVMDALAYGRTGALPPGLTRLPPGGLAGVRALALLYPDCRFGARWKQLDWPRGVVALLVLGRLAGPRGPDACQQGAVELVQQGAALEVIVYQAKRGFDDPARAGSEHGTYAAEAAADARVRVAALFARQWGTGEAWRARSTQTTDTEPR